MSKQDETNVGAETTIGVAASHGRVAAAPPAQVGLGVILICNKQCTIKVKNGAGLLWFSIDPAKPAAEDGKPLKDGNATDKALHAILSNTGVLPPGVYGVRTNHTFSVVAPGWDSLQPYQRNSKDPWPLPPPKKPQVWDDNHALSDEDWKTRWTDFVTASGGEEDVPVTYTFTPG